MIEVYGSISPSRKCMEGKEIGGNQNEIMFIDDGGGYTPKTRVRDIIEKRGKETLRQTPGVYCSTIPPSKHQNFSLIEF